MTMRGTWQTTPGGMDLGMVVGLAGAVVVVAVVAGPVASAAAALVQVVVIAVAAVVVLALAVAAVLVTLRVRRGPAAAELPPGAIHRPVPAQRAPRALPAAELHVHFHGTSAEDMAEALAQIERRMGS